MSLPLFFDLLFIVVLLLFIGIGVYRGFIKGFVRSVRLILSFVAAYTFGGFLGSFLNSAFLGTWIYEGVKGTVVRAIGDSVENMSVEALLASFPPFLVNDSVRENVTNAIASYNGETLITKVSGAIADPISSLLSNFLGYLIVFFAALLLLRLVAWIFTEWVDRLPILGFANRLLGGLWGALTGMLLLITVSIVIKLFFRENEIYTSSVVVRWFCDSAFLDFLNIE